MQDSLLIFQQIGRYDVLTDPKFIIISRIWRNITHQRVEALCPMSQITEIGLAAVIESEHVR